MSTDAEANIFALLHNTLVRDYPDDARLYATCETLAAQIAEDFGLASPPVPEPAPTLDPGEEARMFEDYARAATPRAPKPETVQGRAKLPRNSAACSHVCPACGTATIYGIPYGSGVVDDYQPSPTSSQPGSSAAAPPERED